MEEVTAQAPQEEQPAQELVQETTVTETPVEDKFEVPEKFRGKGLEDVIKSYTNAESELGRLRSKVSDLEKKATKADQLEQQINQYNAYLQQQAVHTTQVPNEDEIFMKEWEQDPARAVLFRAKLAENKTQDFLQQYATQVHYEKAKSDPVNYPDFVNLEPTMVRIAQQRAHLVRPDRLNSPETIDMLYKLARAEHVNDQLTQARSLGAREAEDLRRQKSKAFSEASSPAGSGSVPFEDLSLSEMRKMIGVVER